MAKKKPAADFNMSKAIREILTDNPKLSAKVVTDAIQAKYSTAKIERVSF